MVDFIFVIIELFSLSLTVETLQAEICRSRRFSKGVTLSADLRGKGTSPTNHYWCQSSRVIALSCGIKISAVHHLDLSQSTRVTYRRTDGRTDRQTDRQNYDSQDRSRICWRGNKSYAVTADARLKNSRLNSFASAVLRMVAGNHHHHHHHHHHQFISPKDSTGTAKNIQHIHRQTLK